MLSEPTDPPGLLLPHSPAALLELPDDEHVAQVWAAWLVHQAARKGITPTDITMEMALSVVQPTLEMDTDNVAMAGIEKVLKAIASGNIAGGAKMSRDLLRQGARNRKLLDQYEANRRRQSERAKKPRLRGLTGVIEPWVRKQPDISTQKVLRRLQSRALDGDEVIREVTTDVIRVAWLKPGKGEIIEEIKVKSLPSQISRLRKK
jgi:hypothetical protein